MLTRALAASGALGLTAVLGGCAAMHDGFEATGRLVGSPAAATDEAAAPPPRTDVKTVRSRSGGAPSDETAAVPSAREIFDFHPAGSHPDNWRQPFDIDVDDGPLAGDVRRSAAELKAFNADRKSGAAALAAAGRKPCSETDVATARPGCVANKPGAQAPGVARGPAPPP